MAPSEPDRDASAAAMPDARSAGEDVGDPPAGSDAAVEDAATTDAGAVAPRPPLVFVFTRTTGFRHDSIEAGVQGLRNALAPMGIAVETGADPKVFSPAALARFGAVILLSTTGKPLGDPGTDAIAALAGFVASGGGLVGVHAASSTEYEPSLPYIPLIGGKFVDHPGSVRAATCHTEGSHPGIARLPRDFPVRDEIYVFSNLRADNEIDLRCDAVAGGTRLPIAWHRNEGAGRVFYTALGHSADELTVGDRVLSDHIVPGVLWTLRR
jgi:type 1 glutamine amidotransferase